MSVEMTTGVRPGVKLTDIDWPSRTTVYRTAMIPAPTTTSTQLIRRPRSTSRIGRVCRTDIGSPF